MNLKSRSFINKTLLCWLLFILSILSAHAEMDPPSRVARLSYIDGTVTFAPAGSDDWAYAYLNRPLTSGDRIWSDRGARSELQMGSTGIRLGSETSLDVLELTDSNIQLKLTQGTLSIRVRSLSDGESIEIDTPNIAFTLREPGLYRIDADPNSGATTVTVRGGSGIAYGDDGNSFVVKRPEQVRFYENSLTHVDVIDTPVSDGFDRWIADRERREDASVSARYVSREMIGYEELDAHGTWRQEPEYGAVWVPNVTVVNWAPYRYGHWAWIAPWGWTWVDDAPWGFAPCHYGRWARIRNAWAWVPGPLIARPVYAPALVAFASNGGVSGSSWNVSVSAGAPGIAWFPLAPGEAYRPAYIASPHYVTNINKTVVINKTVNVTNIVANSTVKNVYVNQQIANAVTAVPATAFVHGQPVQKMAIPADRIRLANSPITSMPMISPDKKSLLGKASVASLPPHEAINRVVMATKAAPEPPAFHDSLAQKMTNQHGPITNAAPLLSSKVNVPSVNAMPAVSVIKKRADMHENMKSAPAKSGAQMSAGASSSDSTTLHGHESVPRPPVAINADRPKARENKSTFIEKDPLAHDTSSPKGAVSIGQTGVIKDNRANVGHDERQWRGGPKEYGRNESNFSNNNNQERALTPNNNIPHPAGFIGPQPAGADPHRNTHAEPAPSLHERSVPRPPSPPIAMPARQEAAHERNAATVNKDRSASSMAAEPSHQVPHPARHEEHKEKRSPEEHHGRE